jgi:NADPH-dependent glutamate synthase beta subunit-like oxidoreductase/NAD(P)H-flavin reductase
LGALSEAHYCIFCHNQGKDSCSKGLKDKKTGGFRPSPFGTTLAGCPLEEKISEMHTAKTAGHLIGALALAVVDNPMLAATGHRICNDCMKACIYQKQDPVDIPQAETRILKDVLALPWGFEIYGLLTRWNPLNLRRPLVKAPSGYKVLIVGLGPAGFTLAHHLINDGHAVFAIDGLKIEPLPPELSGVDAKGRRVLFRPIRDIGEIYESLDERLMAGFGGVAEYGITVRWDKNFLKVVRLLLERRREFAMFGGVRFGGTVTADSAFAMGFDHIALCAGAGKPTVLAIPNGLAVGVRQAPDFLMALQLTGAAKADSIANLQVRLPVVIVGGGLTAIDTATESLAYYVVQVDKFLKRYEILVTEKGEAAVRAAWTPAEAEIADEFLTHGRALAAERETARRENRPPDLNGLLQSWGGATIVYRRRLIDSPSYTLNHEEVTKAMEEGVRFAELLAPLAVEVDNHGHAKGLRLARQAMGATGKIAPTGNQAVLPARSILIAAGTQPNTVLAREHPNDAQIEVDGKYFQAFDENGHPVTPERLVKPTETHVLINLRDDGHAISFFGDLHPSFAGNVVKAMASAKRGYPVIGRVLAKKKPSPVSTADLMNYMNNWLRAEVHQVIRLTPSIVEVIVHAPRAARAFRPGQFYRLQNFESLSPRVDGTALAMEGLAMTGAWVDRDKGLVSVIVLEMGGSSNICQLLKPGEPVVLMGPTGSASEIPKGETVVLVGGGLGNAVLFSIGQAMRAAGCRVLYFAGYKKPEDRYHVASIEGAADVVVWCCDEPPGFAPSRPQDHTFVGNLVEAMQAYAEGRLGELGIPLNKVDRIMAIGSDGMMAAVARARHTVLKPYLKPGHAGIGSINSPMQCMMKEICAQCLQRHVDPATGKETVVFSCFNQDQPLDAVDWTCLNQRLAQNGVQEKLTAQWIARCLDHLRVAGAAPAA